MCTFGVSGVIVGVGLVSIIDEIVRVFVQKKLAGTTR